MQIWVQREGKLKLLGYILHLKLLAKKYSGHTVLVDKTGQAHSFRMVFIIQVGEALGKTNVSPYMGTCAPLPLAPAGITNLFHSSNLCWMHVTFIELHVKTASLTGVMLEN